MEAFRHLCTLQKHLSLIIRLVLFWFTIHKFYFGDESSNFEAPLENAHNCTICCTNKIYLRVINFQLNILDMKMMRRMMVTQLVMSVDHPFVFLLHDKRQSIAFFMGRVVKLWNTLKTINLFFWNLFNLYNFWFQPM